MLITAVLLRWYRSFNVRTIGPLDETPIESWNMFRDESFPFIRVPLDQSISTIVGANESGKSHLLSAIAKVVCGKAVMSSKVDHYELKDICRYCGFDGLDDGVWPEIGLQLRVDAKEAALFTAPEPSHPSTTKPTDSLLPSGGSSLVTVMLNGGREGAFATVYVNSVLTRQFSKADWEKHAADFLPEVAILDSTLALPNQVHVDAISDLYARRDPKRVVEALAVQDLWRELEPLQIIQGQQVDAAVAQRIDSLKRSIEKVVQKPLANETELVRQLFKDVLEVETDVLERIRMYSNSERGFVERLMTEVNQRIDRRLDISRYWDQDEDFRLSVDYKSGTFHFQITDRTGSTYTFNERSSGLQYFLSYYIQAKAMENREHKNGVIILMDEPDSFLSATGQRSLLRVFEALISNKTAHAPCQLVYTTHSPFLINRNFPGRIRLVRKGDGTEGTQFVQRAAVRRFEPVRSALAIDSADTLFLGSINVVLEGASDQKLLTACIQRFGEPSGIDRVLDLNAVTLVSADSAMFVAQFVRKAMKGDENPPIVVVLLDGDEAGTEAARDVANVINEKQVCTLREIDVGKTVFQVLEDLLPDSMIAAGIDAFLKREEFECLATFDETVKGDNNADRIVEFCRAHVSELADLRDIEIRAGVVECLAEAIADGSDIPDGEILQSHVEAVCARLNTMIEDAQRNSTRHSLKKLLRQHIETFFKRFENAASKRDVQKLLGDLEHVASGRGEDAKGTRNNVTVLKELLADEANQNSDPVNLQAWRGRLVRLRDEPWANVKDWTVIGPKRQESVLRAANK